MQGITDTTIKPKVVATFEYKDADGKILYIKERIEPARNGRSKEFCFKHQENGQWIKGRGCDPVLFNQPDLIKSKYAFMVEGEGKANLPGRPEHVEVVAVPASTGPRRPKTRFAARARRAAIDFIPDASAEALAASTIAWTRGCDGSGHNPTILILAMYSGAFVPVEPPIRVHPSYRPRSTVAGRDPRLRALGGCLGLLPPPGRCTGSGARPGGAGRCRGRSPRAASTGARARLGAATSPCRELSRTEPAGRRG